MAVLMVARLEFCLDNTRAARKAAEKVDELVDMLVRELVVMRAV